MYNFEEGARLLINKPYGYTSFQAVKAVRSAVRVKKVGHAGTLDPLATGLLIICTGKFTKLLNELQGLDKEYTGTIYLGQRTPSFDRETPVEQEMPYDHITPEMIYRQAELFTGELMQAPPQHSAIWVNGKRAYEMARNGETVEMKLRPVNILEFEITGISLPEVHFRVLVSKGTYIRSLARDFGEGLGCGAHLAALCRTKVGSFNLEDAWELDKFIEQFKQPRLQS